MALGSFGCTVPDEFDPSGGDVAVEVTYTLVGMEPTPEVCAAEGVAGVRLRIWEQYAGGDDYTKAGWFFPCGAPVLTEPVLVPDTYRVGLYAIAVPAMEGEAIDQSDVVYAGLVEASVDEGGVLRTTLDLRPQTVEE